NQEIVGVERVDRRRFDADRAPVRAQLVGQRLGQGRPYPLSHLGLRYDDADMAVIADLEEGVEDRLAFIGGKVMDIAAWPDRPGDDEPSADATADQDAAARDSETVRTIGHGSDLVARAPRCQRVVAAHIILGSVKTRTISGSKL